MGKALSSKKWVALFGRSLLGGYLMMPFPSQVLAQPTSDCQSFWVNPTSLREECLDRNFPAAPVPQPVVPESGDSDSQAPATPVSNRSPGPCFYIWQHDLYGRRCNERAIEQGRQRVERQWEQRQQEQ